MKIIFSKGFAKNYKKFLLNEKNRIDGIVEIFKNNPFDPILKNHALKGSMQGKRSISSGGDIRIIFEVEGDYIRVLFLTVGSHSEIY